MNVTSIKPEQNYTWLLNRHYARRLCTISYAFGIFDNTALIGVITYGMPASNSLCEGVCGKENKKLVIELNRLIIDSNKKNVASMLVSRSLKMLPKPLVVVSYADTGQGHVGYIYQATNFLFTGTTKERTDMGSASGGHSRHGKASNERVNRSTKHRYIYICGNKKQKKQLVKSLKYLIEDYPKGESRKYDASGYVEIQERLI